MKSARVQYAQLQLQQENICDYLEIGVYTIDILTKRNSSPTKEIKQLQSAEADLPRRQRADDKNKQSTTQIIPTTQHIPESYPLLTPPEKNQLRKLVMKKSTVYHSPDDKLTVNIHPNLPK